MFFVADRPKAGLEGVFFLHAVERIKNHLKSFSVNTSAVKVTGERDVFFNSQNRDKIVELIDNAHLSAAEYGKLVIIHFAYIVAVNKKFFRLWDGQHRR